MSYAISVRNSVTGVAVANAAVTIRNFTATGTAQNLSSTTNAAGLATIVASLAGKTTFSIQSEGGRPKRTRVFSPPMLRVTAAGFSSVEMILLEDLI